MFVKSLKNSRKHLLCVLQYNIFTVKGNAEINTSVTVLLFNPSSMLADIKRSKDICPCLTWYGVKTFHRKRVVSSTPRSRSGPFYNTCHSFWCVQPKAERTAIKTATPGINETEGECRRISSQTAVILKSLHRGCCPADASYPQNSPRLTECSQKYISCIC